MSLLLHLSIAAALTAPPAPAPPPAHTPPPLPNDDALPVNFTDHVQPILREHCLSCHRGSRAKNGLKLKSMRGLLLGGSSGAAIVPGDASASLLYLVITHEKSPNMPPDEDRLPDELLQTIRQWIDEGCRETATSKPGTPTPSGPTFQPANLPTAEGSVLPNNAPTQPVWSTTRAHAVTALAASPNAPLIAVGGHEQVTLYGLEPEEVLAVLPFPEGQPQSLRFNPAGTILIGGGGRPGDSGLAIAWDVATGQRLFTLGDEPDTVLDADLSKDGSILILGGPDRVPRAYSTQTGALLYELTKHNDWITATAFSPDGVLLATADRAGGLFIWEAQTGREFHQLESIDGGITAIDWRADSLVLAVATTKGDVRQYEMNNGTRTRRFAAHSGVLSLDFLPDGRIATSGRNAGALIHNADGSRSQTFSISHTPTTAIASTHSGAHTLVGTLAGGLRHYLANEKTPHSLLRPNPRTNEERAVLHSESILATLATELPTLQEAQQQTQATLAQLNQSLPQAQTLATTTEAAAQQASQTAAAAQAAATQAATQLAAFQPPLLTKQEALTNATTHQVQLQTAATQARTTLDEALSQATQTEQDITLNPTDPNTQSAHQAATQALAGATALSQLAEQELSKATITTHSAQTALTLWQARLQTQTTTQTNLQTQATQTAQSATQAQTTATNASQALAALTDQHHEATSRLALTTTTLTEAISSQTHHTTLLQTTRPAWQTLRAHLTQSNGRVPQTTTPIPDPAP